MQAEKEITKTFTDESKYLVQKRNGRDVKYYTKDFVLAYSILLGQTINEQTIRSANLVADFWYTAWIDGGKPDLQELVTGNWEEADKDRLKAEVKAYRKNELIKKKILLSKQNSAKELLSN